MYARHTCICTPHLYLLTSTLHHTCLTPPEPNKFILVSSDHRILFQQSMSLVCLSSANCLLAFLCIIFRRGFLLGWQPCRPIWCNVWRMVWVLTGWHCNAGSTHTSISQTQHLWIWSWARALNFFGRPWRGLFWVEPVLSCPVLYGLGHRAAAQFQGLGNFLIAYAIFM